MQPSEIENLPYYELQYTIDNLVEHLKKEKEAQSDESGSGGTDKMTRDMNKSISQGQKQNQAKAPSMPKAPSMKVPSMPSMGSMKMPKM